MILLLTLILIIGLLCDFGLEFYRMSKESTKQSPMGTAPARDHMSDVARNIAYWAEQTRSEPEYGIGWRLKHQPDCDEITKGSKVCSCTPTRVPD